jgi:hypothetical protein
MLFTKFAFIHESDKTVFSTHGLTLSLRNNFDEIPIAFVLRQVANVWSTIDIGGAVRLPVLRMSVSSSVSNVRCCAALSPRIALRECVMISISLLSLSLESCIALGDR